MRIFVQWPMGKKALIGIALAALLTGCDTVDQRYILISPISSSDDLTYVVPTTDRQAVEQVLEAASSKFALEDRRDLAPRPGIIRRLKEPADYVPVCVDAETSGNLILIWIHQWRYGGFGPTWRFMSIKAMLLTELKKKFGERVSIKDRPPLLNLPARR